jgi:predicted permease
MKWLRQLLSRGRLFADLSEEIQEHLEQKVEALVDQGRSRKDAEHEARREFGNVSVIERDGREPWRWVTFEDVATDFRFALRLMSKDVVFTLTAVIVLGLGICASLSIFGFVDAALLQPLPYRDPSRLVGLYERVHLIPRSNLSYQDYLDWKNTSTVFSSFDAWNGSGFLMATPEGAQPVRAMRVTDGFFRTLGVRPMLGRDFYEGENRPDAAPVAIFDYAAWQKYFGAQPDAIGRVVTLSGVPYTIVGVLPKEFHFALRGTAEVWTTFGALNECEQNRGCHNSYAVARLKDGASLEAAASEIQTIASRLEKQYPITNRGQGSNVVPLSEAIIGDVRPIFLVLLCGAALLLVIACVNVASLLLVRSESRRREMAVRSALGASRSRLIVQFVTEGLVLVAASTVLGLFAAEWTMRLLLTLIPEMLSGNVPYLANLRLNSHILAAAGVLAVVAATLFTLTPAIRLSVEEIREDLAEGSRGSAGGTWRRVGFKLVVAELAIATVLLSGGGLLAKSFYRMLHVELNFQPDHLATVEIAGRGPKYDSDDKLITFSRLLSKKISSLPGVKSVGHASILPVSGNGNTTWIRIVGKPFHGEHNEVNMRDVSAGYFSTIHARLLRGRFFEDREDKTKPRVVVINETFAQQYFRGEDPIGQKIGNLELAPDSLREVIGVVADIREGMLDSEMWPAEYLPFNQAADPELSLVVRTSQDPQSILPLLSATVRDLDTGLGIRGEATMSQRIWDSPTAYLHRTSALLVGGFASLALVLGVVGLYGVVAYSVSQRTREIGVRMALGAQRRSVYELVLGQAGRLTLWGVALGIACALASGLLMRGLLFGVESWDIPTLLTVSLTLGVAALLASYIPARRATRVDPVVALRHQ